MLGYLFSEMTGEKVRFRWGRPRPILPCPAPDGVNRGRPANDNLKGGPRHLRLDPLPVHAPHRPRRRRIRPRVCAKGRRDHRHQRSTPAKRSEDMAASNENFSLSKSGAVWPPLLSRALRHPGLWRPASGRAWHMRSDPKTRRPQRRLPDLQRHHHAGQHHVG